MMTKIQVDRCVVLHGSTNYKNGERVRQQSLVQSWQCRRCFGQD